MCRIFNCYEEIISAENIWRAWREYRNGKRNHTEVSDFEYRLEENLLAISCALGNASYRHGGYQTFVVNDPKRRIISAPSVRDHIVHQAAYNVLYPFFDRAFSPFSFSCRKNYGTHKAQRFLQRYMRSAASGSRAGCWVLHADISKCFDSLWHHTLLGILRKRIACPRTMGLLENIIRSYHTEVGRGIPLGNLTSQLFVNVYLHELDFYVKEQLRVPRYVRYADDLIVVVATQEEGSALTMLLRDFVERQLGLRIPDTHVVLKELHRGVEVLGVRFLPDYHRIKHATFLRSRPVFQERCRAYGEGAISATSLNASWQSLRGSYMHGNNTQRLKELLMNVPRFGTVM